MSVVLDLVIKTILYIQCCQSRLCQYVYQERLWITLSPAWSPQDPQTSHTVPSSCSSPCPPEPQKNPREVVTRAFRKSGLSTRAGERPHLIIASLQHSTNSAWVGGLVRTVCPLPRHGRFPSALPPATRSTGVSALPPTDIRMRFADAFASGSKVFLSLDMRARISACTSRKRFL